MSADHGHDAGTQSPRATYVTIFLILAFLTFIEVFIPQVYADQNAGTLKMLLLVILAVAKALLVAYYFMHLKHEAKWVKWIAAMPVYMGIFVVVILLESLYRGNV